MDVQKKETDRDKSWEKVFQQLYNDRAKLCSGTGWMMKEKVDDVELVFFLGKLRATLTKEGFQFAKFD